MCVKVNIRVYMLCLLYLIKCKHDFNLRKVFNAIKIIVKYFN